MGMDKDDKKQKLFHYTHFNRKIYRGKPIDTENIQRDYKWSAEEFQEVLKHFNDSSNEWEYKCVGCANICLQFCSFCFDAEKTKRRDVYFVNELEIAHHRQNICRGCLGFKLRLFQNSFQHDWSLLVFITFESFLAFQRKEHLKNGRNWPILRTFHSLHTPFRVFDPLALRMFLRIW